MKNTFVDLFLNPNTFYQNLMIEKESLKVPALIVLAGAIIGAAYGYLMGALTGKMMAALTPGMGTIIAISSVFGALVGIFLFWVIWTVVFFIVSIILRKEAKIGLSPEFIGIALGLIGVFLFVLQSLIPKSDIMIQLLTQLIAIIAIIVSIMIFVTRKNFKRSFEFTGYGYLPQVISSLITLVVALNYIPKVKVPELTSAALQDPQAIQEAIKALMHDPAMMELTQITSIVSIVFLLWSANIWIFGMKHARHLSLRDAALCVGVPVVAYIIYVVYTMAVM